MYTHEQLWVCMNHIGSHCHHHDYTWQLFPEACFIQQYWYIACINHICVISEFCQQSLLVYSSLTPSFCKWSHFIPISETRFSMLFSTRNVLYKTNYVQPGLWCVLPFLLLDLNDFSWTKQWYNHREKIQKNFIWALTFTTI